MPIAEIAGFSPRIIDPRESFANCERFGSIEISNDFPDVALTKTKPNYRTAVILLTHDPKLDDPALHVALQSEAFYIGALGSKKTHQQRINRLKQAGFTKKQIDRGIIGKIISAHVRWNSAGVWVKEREINQTEMEYQMRNWYYFNWLCGDHICEQHIHNLDVANWFLNEYPETAQGMGGREIRKDKKFGEIFDHHYVEFKYKSGAIVSSQCRHQPNTHRQVNETIIGTKGVLEISGNGNAIIKNHNGDTLFQYNQRGDESPYQIEHNELFKSIRNGGYINDGENGAKATLTSVMGRMATYTGKVVEWEEAMNADDNMIPKYLSWNSNPPTLPDSNGYYKIPKPGSF